MPKPSRLIIVFFFAILIGCSKNEQPPALPTKSDFEGYWKLSTITQSGTPINIDAYVSPIYGKGLKNQYYYFASTGEFVETNELSINVLVWTGQWEITDDRLMTSSSGGGNSKFKIISFGQNEFIITNQLALEYNLGFIRIEKNGYPETLMTATVDGQNFTARSNQAYLESGGYIQLTGDNSQSDWISITLNDPASLVAGVTYTIGDGKISSVYRKGNSDILFGAYEGQVKIEKITSDYVDVTFSFKAKTQDGDEVNIINGKFKAIIKDNS